MEGVPKTESNKQRYEAGDVVSLLLRYAGQSDGESTYVGKTQDGDVFYVTSQSTKLEGTRQQIVVESLGSGDLGEEAVYFARVLSETASDPEAAEENLDSSKNESEEEDQNLFATALAGLRAQTEGVVPPERQQNTVERQTFEKGEIVRGISLQQRADGKYVSSGGQDRKAFLVDSTSIDPRLLGTKGLSLNDSFVVRVKNDSAPGRSKGVVVVELIGPESAVNESGFLDEESLTPEAIQVENGILDVSLYTPEQLENVEGVEAGTLFINVFFRPDNRFANVTSFSSDITVNNKRLSFFSDSQMPEVEGVYDFEVGRIGDFVYLGGFTERFLNQEKEFNIEDLFDDVEQENQPNPERVTISAEQLADAPKHSQMLKAQASRLKTPEIQTALQQAHVYMSPYSSGAEVLRRSRDMRAAELTETVVGPNGSEREVAVEKHRHFTGLGSALYREKGAYRAFNAGVDTTVEHSSQEMRAWLEDWEGDEPPRLPVLVIGTGPHGATFLSTYAIYNQSAPAVAVDQRSRIGGQFASAEEPVLRLNSRNRPQMEGDDRELRNLPGTEQTINPLGTMATLQLSDLSGESYVTQDALAHATRFNTVTSVDNFLTKCALIGTETVTRAGGQQVERCTFYDENQGSVYTIDTDNLVIAGGIGKDEFRLANADSITEQQLKREAEKFAQGIRPNVMSYPQLQEWFGDPRYKVQ